MVQFADEERALKHKLLVPNAYHKALDFDFLQAMPREELHQFLIGVYGDYVIPSTLYEIQQILRRPDLVTSKPGAENVRYLVSNEMLASVWARLRDRLSALDSSSSMVEVTVDYAAHFYDMYVDKHTGKHLTGERVRILLLTLPFLLRDLIAPEVTSHTYMLYGILYNMSYIICRSSMSTIQFVELSPALHCTNFSLFLIHVTV